jgi:hypothetical protein
LQNVNSLVKSVPARISPQLPQAAMMDSAQACAPRRCLAPLAARQVSTVGHRATTTTSSLIKERKENQEKVHADH